MNVIVMIAFTLKAIAAQSDSFYISPFAGSGIKGFSIDGLEAQSARFQPGVGIWVDSSEVVYFCESNNNKVRSVDTSGILGTLAGTGSRSGGGSSGSTATSVSLAYPIGVWGNANAIYLSAMMIVRHGL